jgi:hypothetical protein
LSTGFCCGQSNYYPVYINPELEGCYTPQIPGYQDACYDVPAGLLGPPKILPQKSYDPADTIDSAPALIHPVSVKVPRGRDYVIFGCYGAAPIPNPTINLDGVFNDVFGYSIVPISPATLDNCAAQCDGRNYDYFGMVNGTYVPTYRSFPFEVPVH